MTEQPDIINRVAQSSLITFNLEDYYQKGERVLFDIKDWLFQGLILREKDFRAAVKEHDWERYKGTHVAMICTVEAIVPTWAYMLIATRLQPYAETIIHGNLDELEKVLFKDSLDKVKVEEFRDKKIVIKGCGSIPVPNSAYVQITSMLRPVVASIMYGEPCSTVPLYKKSRK
ncbi:DUF2480 family protein [Fulvivirga sp. 29W222]|uniref:DUF2480 family protein n=1 Tax=Fulvivirga marina TaxID=2494733 RepID=A0A937FUP1_9BACT|nr:DUF2480 family protein [Fulvivirga marina]MBL6446369.1 DUF2480 family protein [Fulvivirga marina]